MSTQLRLPNINRTATVIAVAHPMMTWKIQVVNLIAHAGKKARPYLQSSNGTLCTNHTPILLAAAIAINK